MFKASVQDARLILSRPLGYRFRAVLVSEPFEERLTVELPHKPTEPALSCRMKQAKSERQDLRWSVLRHD